MDDLKSLEVKNNPVEAIKPAVVLVKQIKSMKLSVPADFSEREREIYIEAWKDCCDMINGELIVQTFLDLDSK